MQHVAPEVYEQQRLEALHSLDLLSSPPEPEFDELVRLAAAICGTPISMISLLDADRLWSKAATGLDLDNVPREVAFCDHTIRQTGLMLVEDATVDPRFATNPFVVTGPGVRFYAGFPVTDPEGFPVGALCVIDRVPRTLTPEQRNALRVLASQVTARIELRVKVRELEQALARAEAVTAQLSATEQRFVTFMDSGPFLAYLKDREGRLLYYNNNTAKHYNVSSTSLLHKCDDELWPGDLARLYREHDLQVLRSGKLQVLDEQLLNPDGSLSAWRSYKFPCADPDGGVLVGGFSLEVTAELRREEELKRSQAELKEANGKLRELASIDGLTGLTNRRTFDEQLKLAFQHARKRQAPLSILMLDVDHFKSHNDRFGHAHGDAVLRTVASCLRNQLRVGDLIARYGGEEFVVLLADTDDSRAHSLADRLLQAVRSHAWGHAPVTLSAGIGTLNPTMTDSSRLLTLADEALYVAKCTGRDRAVAYTEVYCHALEALRKASTPVSPENPISGICVEHTPSIASVPASVQNS